MRKMFTKQFRNCCYLLFAALLVNNIATAQYCTSSSTYFDEEYLTNVTFAGIDNNSQSSSYSDFTSISGVVVPGSSYQFSGTISNAGGYPETITVFIDWDQNQIFDPVTERYTIGTSCTSNNCILTQNITIPTTAVPGSTRMRVIEQYSSNITTACGTYSFGETEDYSLTVLSGECTPPNFEFTVTNNCEADTYSISALLSDFGSNNFITIYLTRSDNVPVSPITVISAIQGQTVNILNNIPFGVTVTASIEGQNALCNLSRSFAELVCPAENDEACDATVLQCGDALNNQTFIGSTQSFDDNCGGPSTRDVWYKFTSDGLQKYIIAASQADVVVDLWSGDNCEAISQVSPCQDYPESFEVTEAGTYYFRIRAYFNDIDFYSVSLTCVPFDCEDQLADYGAPCDDGDPNTYKDKLQTDCSCAGFVPVPGQICEVPLVVSSLPYTTMGNTQDYFDDYEQVDVPPFAPGVIGSGSNQPYYLNGDDVVYAYTPTSNQSINITVTNVEAYAGMFVFTGCPFASTVAYANTSYDPQPFSVNGLVVQANVTYYIVISTWASPQSTSYMLNIQSTAFDCPALEANIGSACDDGNANTVNDKVNSDCECAGIPIPPNDEACNATMLMCGDTLANESFAGATASMIDDCFNSQNGDLWYSVTVEEGFYNHVVFQGSGPSSTYVTAQIFVSDDCNELTEVFVPCTPLIIGLYLDSAATYYIRVRSYDNAEAVTMILNCYEEAENGECDLATELTCGETYLGNTIAAPERDPNLQFCGTGGSIPAIFNRGVWFTYTPDTDVEATFDLSGSTFDTEIFLYSGACDNLICVNGDDEGGEGSTSLLTETLDANTTYYIFVTGWNNSRGEYVLNMSCIDLACSPTISSLEAVNAQGDPLSCVTLGSDYYLQVTLSGGTQSSYNVTAGGSPITVINADGTGIVGPISGGDATVTVTGTANPNCGANQLYDVTACPPLNDDACGATVLTCGQSVTQPFDGATPSIADACYSPTNPDLWFKFTADGTQTYKISLGEVPFYDAIVQLFKGDDCGNLTQVSGCQDTPQYYNITIAGTYYARARAWSSVPPQQPITVSLTCSPFDCPGVGNYGGSCDDGNPATVNDIVNASCECVGVPVTSNDEACTATVLSCGDALTGLSFAGATPSFDDDCYGSGTKDVWFKFIADGVQTYTVAETSTGDMVVSLHSGDDCGNLSQVGVCQDGPESFAVTQAGTYYFRIRPYSTASSYAVSLTCTPFDCPGVGNIGGTCDDGDATTINDKINSDCECVGIPIATNDEPCIATNLSCGVPVVQSTAGATQTMAPITCEGFTAQQAKDVWFKFTADGVSSYTINETASSDLVLEAFSSDGCDDLTSIACADIPETIEFGILAAGEYYVRAYAYSDFSPPYDINIQLDCVNNNAVTLNGTVNWNSNCGSRDGTVKLYTPNTATLIGTYNITVAAGGTFTIENLPTGTFDVIVKVQGYLAKGIQDVVIATGTNNLAVGTIRNGNVNNDNSINLFDVSLINAAFNRSVGHPSYNPLADLNCDGSINIFDISILNASFNKAGAIAPLN